tara:strand:- start:541 stop:1293 length:753 start_codon:yes stop_codon:yes gene_type:complete
MSRVNLIPMAGNGQRFLDEGYKIPKPLIEIREIPMVIHSAQSLPPADKWIFICRQYHLSKFGIDKVIKNYYPNSVIISIDKATEGQASTCLLAKDYINDNDSLVIGACDNSIEYDIEKYNSLSKNVDALIFTFKNNESASNNPEMYGWVDVDRNLNAKRVSCKAPISKNPINDHAIVGTFFFKEAAYFFQNTKQIISSNLRINNEFYIDSVMDECLRSGLKISALETSEYNCWGTPHDLEKYLKNNFNGG